MQEGIPTFAPSPKPDQEPRGSEEHHYGWRQKFLKLGMFLSTFVAVHNAEAQKNQQKTNPTIVTADKNKVNAYKDSLDIYRKSIVAYNKGKKEAFDEVESNNKVKRPDGKKLEFSEKIQGPFPDDAYIGKRTGMKMFPEHGVTLGDKRNEVVRRTTALYKNPIQPYEMVQPSPEKLPYGGFHPIETPIVLDSISEVPLPEIPAMISQEEGFSL